MSLKTEDSLNCPCNGIYKCGFHSVPKFILEISDDHYKELMKIIERMEVGTPERKLDTPDYFFNNT